MAPLCLSWARIRAGRGQLQGYASTYTNVPFSLIEMGLFNIFYNPHELKAPQVLLHHLPTTRILDSCSKNSPTLMATHSRPPCSETSPCW